MLYVLIHLVHNRKLAPLTDIGPAGRHDVDNVLLCKRRVLVVVERGHGWAKRALGTCGGSALVHPRDTNTAECKFPATCLMRTMERILCTPHQEMVKGCGHSTPPCSLPGGGGTYPSVGRVADLGTGCAPGAFGMLLHGGSGHLAASGAVVGCLSAIPSLYCAPSWFVGCMY